MTKVLENNILSADDILKHLHVIIDNKFGRTNRAKKVNPNLLELKITLFTISKEYENQEPELISNLLKELVKRGSVTTNFGNKGVYPFDAYFIPTTEILNKEHFEIYTYVKRILHNK